MRDPGRRVNPRSRAWIVLRHGTIDRSHGPADQPHRLRPRRRVRRLRGRGAAPAIVDDRGQQPHPVARGSTRRAPAQPDHAPDQPDRGRPGLLRALHAGPGRPRGGGPGRRCAAIDTARNAAALCGRARDPVRGTGDRRLSPAAPTRLGRPLDRRANGGPGRRGLRPRGAAGAAAQLHSDRAAARGLAPRAVLRARAISRPIHHRGGSSTSRATIACATPSIPLATSGGSTIGRANWSRSRSPAISPPTAPRPCASRASPASACSWHRASTSPRICAWAASCPCSRSSCRWSSRSTRSTPTGTISPPRCAASST